MSVDADIARLVLTGYDGTKLPIGPFVESWDYGGSMADEVPHYTITVGDADESIRSSPVLDRQGDEVLDRGVTCFIDVDRKGQPLKWEVVSVRPSGMTVDVIVEPYFVCRLRRRNRVRVFPAGRYTRAQALRTLIRTEEPEVTFICPARGEAGAAERLREALAKAADPDDAPSKAGGAPGIAKGAKLTVKGPSHPATAAQRKVGEELLSRARAHDASPKATKALLLAGIVESELTNLPGGDRDSRGVLQIRDSTNRAINRDVSNSADAFLLTGFYSKYATGGSIPSGRGGAIAIAHDKPAMTAGQVAQSAQGSGKPSAYDDWSKEADAWMEAFSGASPSSSSTGAPARAKADTQRLEWKRGTQEEPEDTMEFGNRLATDARFAFFPTLDIEIVYADERDLLQARAAATFHPHQDGVDFIDGGWDSGHGVDKLTVNVLGLQPRDIGHGCPVVVRDAGASNGRYLVGSVKVGSGDEAGTLELRRAVNPKREAAIATASSSAKSASNGSTGRATSTLRERIVGEAEKTLTVKTGYRRYSQPGALTSDPTPPAPARTDCSQWVRAIYLKAGAKDPGTNTVSQANSGRRTTTPKPGDLVLDAPSGRRHVELYRGNGKTYGHGSAAIDGWTVAEMRQHFGAVFFVTFDFLD